MPGWIKKELLLWCLQSIRKPLTLESFLKLKKAIKLSWLLLESFTKFQKLTKMRKIHSRNNKLIMVPTVIAICLIAPNLLVDKSSKVQVASAQAEKIRQIKTFSANTYVYLQMSNHTTHLFLASRESLLEAVKDFIITFQETKLKNYSWEQSTAMLMLAVMNNLTRSKKDGDWTTTTRCKSKTHNRVSFQTSARKMEVLLLLSKL